ncbi:MAG: cysteine desulfurase family protein [Geminicoccaceae bacterium]
MTPLGVAGPPAEDPVYLDHAAMTPVRPEAIAAMAEALRVIGNPSSPHGPGRHARQLVERSRRALGDRLGVGPAQVIFTSGGTEANNLALAGLPGPRLVSAVEHASVLDAVQDTWRAPVDADGVLDLEALASLAQARQPRLVSVMLANNETGVLQPVREAASLAHAQGALLHCDAVQAFGKVPVTLEELGADLISISAHKLGGPPGVGALIVRPGIEPQPRQRGGSQEFGRRAGTLNLPAIVGFAAALDLATDWQAIARLRDALERQVLELRPDVLCLSSGVLRLPNLSCLITPGLAGELQLMALDLAGVAVSVGAACSSGKVGPSTVLAAMGLPTALARCAVRVSLGWTSKPAHVDRFVEAWSAQVGRSAAGRMVG